MDTLGWDTVFAISLDRVNAALNENSALLPLHFSGKSEPDEAVSFSIDATSHPWQLVPRRSGALFDLIIPFVSGSVTVLGQPVSDIGGVTISIEVDLRWLPSAVSANSSVAFAFTAPASTKTGALLSGGNALNPLVAAVLPFIVARYLARHAGAISYALATLDPAVAAGSWLRPAASAFTILQDSGSGRAYLTILGTLAEQDVSQLSRAVPLSLPQTSDAVFVLSGDLVLSRVVRPALAAAFGVPDETLGLTPAHSIQGSGFGLGGVQSGAIVYQPQVGDLQSVIDNGALVTSVRGDCDMKLNIMLHYAVTARCPFSFNAQSQSIVFNADPAPVKQKDVDIPWYDWLLGPVADAIMAIVVNVIASDLGDKINAAVAAAGSVQTLPSVLAWSGLRTPQLTSGRLDGALILTGTF